MNELDVMLERHYLDVMLAKNREKVAHDLLVQAEEHLAKARTHWEERYEELKRLERH